MSGRCDRLLGVDILAYLDEPDSARSREVRAHAATCRQCLEELLGWESLRAERSPDATDHVPEDSLVAYADARDTLSRGVLLEIREHLAACSSCRNELGVLESVRIHPELVANAAGSFGLWADLVRRIVARMGAPARRPALAFAVIVVLSIPVLSLVDRLRSGSTMDTALPAGVSEEGSMERRVLDATSVRSSSDLANFEDPGAGRVETDHEERGPNAGSAQAGSRGQRLEGLRKPLRSLHRSDAAREGGLAAPSANVPDHAPGTTAGLKATVPRTTVVPAVAARAGAGATAPGTAAAPGAVPAPASDDARVLSNLLAEVRGIGQRSGTDARGPAAVAVDYVPGARAVVALGSPVVVRIRLAREATAGPEAKVRTLDAGRTNPTGYVASATSNVVLRVSTSDGRVTAFPLTAGASENNDSSSVELPAALLGSGDNRLELYDRAAERALSEPFTLRYEGTSE